MEMLNNKGIKLFVVAASKISNFECVFLFFCLFMLSSTSVNAWKIVFIKSSYESTTKRDTCQIFKRTDFWCTFSCSICNQNGHFIRCIQKSSFLGYDGIHKSWEDIISYEEQWPQTKTKGKGITVP